MPKITYSGITICCDPGDNLRQVLLQHNLGLYNGKSKLINCRGIGSCGTCAVAIVGQVSPLTTMEKVRFSFPPHNLDNHRRLACQTRVLGNLVVDKYEGFWGQGNQRINRTESQ